MRIALAQVDSALGDLDANAARAREAIDRARAQDAELVVFPELQLSGYALAGCDAPTAVPARDLARLVQTGGDDPSLLLGFHERDGAASYDSAAYLERARVRHVHRKLALVGYPPFDEDASFAAGETLRAFDVDGARVAVLVCNDAWQPALAALAVHDGAEVLLVPAASPTHVVEAESCWRDLTRVYARLLQCYVVFVNRVGEERGMRFWGGSHVVDPAGEVVVEAPRLDEALVVADLDLDRLRRRRRELPLLADPRLDVLADACARLATHQGRVA
jgi:predicted amidohydrolase